MENLGIERALSGLRPFFATENPLKMIKIAFYFGLKALLFLKMFTFLSQLTFWSCRKTARLERSV